MESLAEKTETKEKTFFADNYKEDVVKYKTAFKAWRSIALISTGITLLLAVGYFNIKNSLIINVEVPGKELTVGQKMAGQEYHKLFAKDVLLDFAEFNPSTVSEKVNEISRKMDGYYLKQISDKLQTMIRNVKTSNMTQIVTPTKIETTTSKDLQTATTRMEAFVTRKVGDVAIFTNKPCLFMIETRIEGGFAYASNYTDNCN